MRLSSNRKTQFDHERDEEKRLRVRLNLLHQIKAELNPQEFTVAEARQEFEAYATTRSASFDFQPVDIEKELAVLKELGYVEKISARQYRVTDKGMELEDPLT